MKLPGENKSDLWNSTMLCVKLLGAEVCGLCLSHILMKSHRLKPCWSSHTCWLVSAQPVVQSWVTIHEVPGGCSVPRACFHLSFFCFPLLIAIPLFFKCNYSTDQQCITTFSVVFRLQALFLTWHLAGCSIKPFLSLREVIVLMSCHLANHFP
jgi:hypothetical protein